MVKRVVEKDSAKTKKKQIKQTLSVKKIREDTQFPKKEKQTSSSKRIRNEKPTKQTLSVKKIREDTQFPKKEKQTSSSKRIRNETKPLNPIFSIKKILGATIFPTKKPKTNSKQSGLKVKTHKVKTQSQKTIQSKSIKNKQITPKKLRPQSRKNIANKNKSQAKKTPTSKSKEKIDALFKLVKQKVTDNTSILKIVIICLITIILILSLILILKPKNESLLQNVSISNNSQNSIQKIGSPIKETKSNNSNETKNKSYNNTYKIIQTKIKPPKENIGKLKSFNLIVNTSKEKLLLQDKYKKLNLYEKIVNVFRQDIRERELPLFLGGANNLTQDDKQEIILSDKLLLHDFQENNYNDGEETTGFVIPKNLPVFTYKIQFKKGTKWTDLEDKYIKLFGKNYQILDYSPQEKEISLVENPLHFDMSKKDVVKIKTLSKSENLSVVYFMGENKVILNISGKKTHELSKGSQFFTDNFFYYVEDVAGINQNPNGQILMIASDKILVLKDWITQRPSNGIYDLLVNINSTDEYINDISINWTANQDLFLTSESSLYLPFFNTIKLYMSDEHDMDPDDENTHYYSNYWEVFLDANSEKYQWESNETDIPDIQ